MPESHKAFLTYSFVNTLPKLSLYSFIVLQYHSFEDVLQVSLTRN